MRVNLISLGCPKALVDSEKILGALGASGICITTSITDSDIIILNTCGFIEPALRETEAEIETLSKYVKETGKRLYVFGCAVNRFKQRLKDKYPQVTKWFTLEQTRELIRTIKAEAADIESRLLSTKGYAYLKIADGCSNYCSYCTIPFIKGEYRSVEMKSLTAEAVELTKLGAKEIILIAQDTTAYGIDIYKKPMLVPLIKNLTEIRDIEWIRIMYAHPKTISEEMISEIMANDKVCKYIDLPIQHINDRILSLMNRGVERHRIEEVIHRFMNIKGISIRTTVIVGFPTETNDEFEELLDFLKAVEFDWIGVFPYFKEPGTKAAALPQVPDELINQRFETLIALQKEKMTTRNRKMLGTVQKTIIHRRNGDFIGHCRSSAPDIDSNIVIKSSELELGGIYDIKITGMDEYDLHGVAVKQRGVDLKADRK